MKEVQSLSTTPLRRAANLGLMSVVRCASRSTSMTRPSTSCSMCCSSPSCSAGREFSANIGLGAEEECFTLRHVGGGAEAWMRFTDT